MNKKLSSGRLSSKELFKILFGNLTTGECLLLFIESVARLSPTIYEKDNRSPI